MLLIEHVDILASLYEQVVIPSAVATELRHWKAPAVVRAWIATPPPWCVIRQAQGQPDSALLQLGPGEREALMLVEELGAEVFLTDDLEGREEAIYRGIAVTNRRHEKNRHTGMAAISYADQRGKVSGRGPRRGWTTRE
jgi:predicted nucleic acid-binding protein